MKRILIVVGMEFVIFCVISPSLKAQKIVSYRQVVEQANTTTLVLSSMNPSLSSSPVVFTAHVNGVPAGIPTGTVAFIASQKSGQIATATVPLDATGSAAWTISLASGQYGIMALYSGDTDYLASVSSTLSQAVGRSPDFTINVPSTLTVVQGASGSAAVSIESINGFAGTIHLECSGVPKGSSCNFALGSITIPSSSTAAAATSASSAYTTTLTVTTAGTTVTTLGILGFFLGWGSFSRKRFRYRSMIWIGGAILLATVTGCVGSNRYVQVDGTPVGYYQLAIVATSGAITHSSTMTLHVVAQ